MSVFHQYSNSSREHLWETAAQFGKVGRVPQLSALALLAVTIGLTGCGGREITLVPVEGRVARSDGSPWPRRGLIFFAPESAAPGFPLRGAYARFDIDGSFVAGTFEPGDGMIPGQYLVSLRCWEVAPGTNKSADGKSCVPADFQHGSRSGLKVDVPADDSETIVVQFEIPAA